MDRPHITTFITVSFKEEVVYSDVLNAPNLQKPDASTGTEKGAPSRKGGHRDDIIGKRPGDDHEDANTNDTICTDVPTCAKDGAEATCSEYYRCLIVEEPPSPANEK